MDLQARDIVLSHRIDPDTLNVISCEFSFEVYSEELLEKSWDTIMVSYSFQGDAQIKINQVQYYAGAEEESIPLSELKEELEEDGFSYEDIVYFAKLQVNRLVTKHASKCF